MRSRRSRLARTTAFALFFLSAVSGFALSAPARAPAHVPSATAATDPMLGVVQSSPRGQP